MARFNPQRGILAPLPDHATFLSLSLRPDADATFACGAIATLRQDPHVLLGLGAPLLERIPRFIPGHRRFPRDMPLFPATQADAWFRLSHRDPTHLHDAMGALLRTLEPHFDVVDETRGFIYRGGRDLSGFRDGTENPRGAAAADAALVKRAGAGLDGGSFVLVQRWVHDLKALNAMPEAAQEAVVGRRKKSDKEIADAPLSAHISRTRQEDFSPPAVMVRRSMPYGGWRERGLYFVAFVASLDRVEAMLRRMAGRDDGIVDGLFSYSRAVSGAYYFCPPTRAGAWDLRAVLPPVDGKR